MYKGTLQEILKFPNKPNELTEILFLLKTTIISDLLNLLEYKNLVINNDNFDKLIKLLKYVDEHKTLKPIKISDMKLTSIDKDDIAILSATNNNFNVSSYITDKIKREIIAEWITQNPEIPYIMLLLGFNIQQSLLKQVSKIDPIKIDKFILSYLDIIDLDEIISSEPVEVSSSHENTSTNTNTAQNIQKLKETTQDASDKQIV